MVDEIGIRETGNDILGLVFSIIAIIITMILVWFLGFQILGVFVVLILLFLAGIFDYFYVYKRTENWKSFFIILPIIFIIFIGLYWFGKSIYLAMPGETLGQKIGGLLTKVGMIFIKPFEKITEYQKKYEAALTGDYFTGKVDKNRYEPIGVYLEDLKPADPYFYSNEPVIVWATLKAKVLDEPVNVSVGCNAKEIKGQINPKYLTKDYAIDLYEEEDIECNLPPLSEGIHKVTFNADFNFKTMAYIKSYFIDKTRLRTMTREGIDVLDQYGIKDKSPVAIYSNGPVEIGMQVETGKQPIGIYTEPSRKYLNSVSLGVTLNNRWDGGIKEITNLIIKVPDGLSMDNLSCEKGYDFRYQQCYGEGAPMEECEEGYNLYILSKPKKLKVETFETFKCDFNVDPDLRLLGTTPIATRYFKVIVEYNYRLNKSTVVSVKKGEETEAITKKPSILEDAKSTATALSKGTVVWSKMEQKVTKDQIKSYLTQYAPDLINQVDNFYNYGAMYDIDPAFAIAVAMHESWGYRSIVSKDCRNLFGISFIGTGTQCVLHPIYRKFGTIRDSITEFYRLIKQNYVDGYGQDTPAKIVCIQGSGFETSTHCYAEAKDQWYNEVTAYRAKIQGIE